MSILWTLRKWVDPIEYAKDQAAGKRARESQPVDPAYDDGDLPMESGPPAPVRRYRCRICDWRSIEDAYCPKCVAQTMLPVK